MSAFLYTVAEDLIHRFGNDLKDVAIVFNNKRPIVFLKKHLADLSKKPIFSPSFFTIQSFFSLSSEQIQADFIMRFFVLHKAYNELLRSEGKNEIGPDDFLPMAEIILRDFDQIDFDLVDPFDIYSYLKDLAVIEQQFPLLTVEQLEYLTQFWSSFSNEKQVYIQAKFIELWERLPVLYEFFQTKLKEQNLSSISTIYRELANGTAVKGNFVNDFKQVVFIGFNALNKAEATLFKKWQREEKAIFYFDADPYYMKDPIQEAGLFLRKNTMEHRLENALGEFPNVLNDPTKGISVFPVIGHVAQAKILTKILDESIYGSSETAIILADESLLVPVLQTIPNELKINITMGFPISQSPLFGFLDLWMTVQEHLFEFKTGNLKKDDISAFLSHSLSGMSTIEHDRLMHILDHWRPDEIPIDALSFNPPIAEAFFKGNSSGLALIDSLEKLISKLYEWLLNEKKLHLIESSLLVRLSKAISLMNDSLTIYNKQISVPLSIAFIRKSLIGIAAPIEGEPLDGIQVMGMLESRCLDFNEVIILGANEGVLPHLSISPTFIPDSLRRAFGLPVLENQDALSAYLFYRLLQRAKKITIVYNSLVEGNSTGEPSRFLQQVQFESKLSTKVFPQRQLIELSSPTPSLKIQKSPEIMAKLEEYVKPGGKYFSASALLTYLKCPLEFFFKYIGGFKEPDRPLTELDLGNIGTMVHSVLEGFYENFYKHESLISKDDILNRMKELPALCKKTLSEFLYEDSFKAVKFNSSQLIALSIIEENARVILNYDSKQIAPFRIIELENKEDYRCQFPVEINGERMHINLFAIIDRVDEVKGQKRIVDYKTGGDKLTFKMADICTDVTKNLNRAAFQSLLYTLVYEEVKQVHSVQPHLYILRQIQHGSLLIKDKEPLEGNLLEETKKEFKEALNRLLSEIFDPAIPFSHNEYSQYCIDGVYSQLCHPSGLMNTNEDEIEIH